MMEGILRTGELLRARDAQDNPMVYFHEDLAETLYEFDRYVWDIETEKPDSKAPDHMMENLYRDWETHHRDRKSTRLNSSHSAKSRMPSSA